MNVQLQVLDVRAPGDFDSAFSEMSKNRSHALIVLGSPIFFADRARIVALASENHLPSMYLLKQYVEAGGLMSYGASNREVGGGLPRTWTRCSRERSPPTCLSSRRRSSN